MGVSFFSSLLLAGALSAKAEPLESISVPDLLSQPLTTPLLVEEECAVSFERPTLSQAASASAGSWIYPAAFAATATGFYALRRRAENRRLMKDEVLREVGSWRDEVGTLTELVKRQERQSYPYYFAHGHPVRTPGQAKAALVAYRQFEKIGYYLETLPNSAEVQKNARLCLRHKVSLAYKLADYVAHIRQELGKISLTDPRNLLRLEYLNRDEAPALVALSAYRSPLDGSCPFFVEQAEKQLAVLHKYRKEGGRLLASAQRTRRLA